MDAKPIQDILPTVLQEKTPATRELTQLPTGASDFLSMVLQETKLKDETLQNIQEMFQYLFMLVGLRSIPNQADTVFLVQEFRSDYGNHPISEIKLAFKKALRGELEIDARDVKCYDNFSIAYVAPIMSAYRIWADKKFREYERFIPPSPNDQKLLEGPRRDDINWGKIIEDEYQHYLSFGKEKAKFWPVEIYNQLVKDDLIDEELWRKAMPVVRKKSIEDLVKQRAVLEMRTFSNADKNQRVAFAQSINETNVAALDKKIKGYRDGEKDGEIELLAKQYCILQFFMLKKKLLKKNIYQPES